MESDQLKLLARSVAPIDAVVADVGGMGLRVFINDAGAVGSIATVLEGAAQGQRAIGRGPVQLCLMGAGLNGEVDVELGDDFPVNPQIKGAIKSLGGVVSVEEI